MSGLLYPPLVAALEGADNILLAGAGGGFDVFTGLPLYFALRQSGKTVHLANLSFSTIHATTGQRLGPALVEVNARTEGHLRYFPELHLCRWFQQERGEDVSIYCLDRTGVKPVTQGYQALAERLKPDALILVDGGTDCLMRGDEVGLGTPQEDIASLAAADALDIPTKLLLCIGFGIDTFHGVCHAQFLEAVAELTRSGDFLGAWSLTGEMPEARLYREAMEFVGRIMFHHPSIVNSSILSAVEGRFGNYHAASRTEGSELFINPLMALYWAFRLRGVARRNLYLEQVRDTETYVELSAAIERFRHHLPRIREWTNLPI